MAAKPRHTPETRKHTPDPKMPAVCASLAERPNLFDYPSFYLFVYLSMYLSVYLFSCLTYLSIYLSIYLPFYLSVCLLVYLFVGCRFEVSEPVQQSSLGFWVQGLRSKFQGVQARFGA